MAVAQHMAAVHVAHDVLDRGKRHIDMRCVVHTKNDAGHDLQRQQNVKTMPQIHIQFRFFGVGIINVS